MDPFGVGRKKQQENSGYDCDAFHFWSASPIYCLSPLRDRNSG
jgi:hypothetical protein